MPARWFVVPPIDSPEDGIAAVPKYSERVDGYSGQRYTFPESSVLPFAGDDVYVVRFEASDTVLDEIEAHADAYTREEYGLTEDDVAGWLNQHFDRDLSFDKWTDRFKTSSV